MSHYPSSSGVPPTSAAGLSAVSQHFLGTGTSTAAPSQHIVGGGAHPTSTTTAAASSQHFLGGGAYPTSATGATASSQHFLGGGALPTFTTGAGASSQHFLGGGVAPISTAVAAHPSQHFLGTGVSPIPTDGLTAAAPKKQPVNKNQRLVVEEIETKRALSVAQLEVAGLTDKLAGIKRQQKL